MRITLYPFFSQQNKVTRHFRLDSDSGVKLYAYMAQQCTKLGHDVRFVLPPDWQCEGIPQVPVSQILRSPKLALSNLDRRLQWDPEWLRCVGDTDLLLTQHEFLAYPLRCLFPGLRIAMECGIKPDTAWPQTRDLFPLAWKAATLVHCNSTELAAMVTTNGGKAVVWQFAYADAMAVPRGSTRDIDVLFPARCSSTNYSNHVAFMTAFERSTHRVVMTDPTNYLGTDPRTSEEYTALLHRSKVVVGLTDNGYGGYAFREAIAAGACPVALDCETYRKLLTNEWPYYCKLDNVASIVERALVTGWKSLGTKLVQQVGENLRQSSYSSAWKQAKEDLCL